MESHAIQDNWTFSDIGTSDIEFTDTDEDESNRKKNKKAAKVKCGLFKRRLLNFVITVSMINQN